MGEAAEEAGDGVGAAIVRREGSPRGAGGGGMVEDGLHPRAEGGGAAALWGESGEVGLESGPGGVGEEIEELRSNREWMHMGHIKEYILIVNKNCRPPVC